jgi:hypothetical protein
MYPKMGKKAGFHEKKIRQASYGAVGVPKKMPARQKIRLLSENALFWNRLHVLDGPGTHAQGIGDFASVYHTSTNTLHCFFQYEILVVMGCWCPVNLHPPVQNRADRVGRATF